MWVETADALRDADVALVDATFYSTNDHASPSPLRLARAPIPKASAPYGQPALHFNPLNSG